jgi:hypothetical protein
MLVELDVPFVDAKAADLALALGAPRQDAVSVLSLSCGGYQVELRLLGCSHQALISADGYELSELVACQADASGPLPAAAAERRGGRSYEFAASTRVLSRTDYAALAQSVTNGVAALDQGLVGTFPAPDGAFTALRFTSDPSGDLIKWKTWHGYPQTDEIVLTESQIAR